MLLFLGPAGVEGFFRDAGKPAEFLGLPHADEQFLDRDALKAIGAHYNSEFVGPPLPPKACLLAERVVGRPHPVAPPHDENDAVAMVISLSSTAL